MKNDYISVLSHGVSCFAVCLLEKLNIWRKLKKGYRYPNRLSKHACVAVHSALQSLLHDGIVCCKNSSYRLTPLGHEIDERMGLFLMFFDGYRQLISNQEQICRGNMRPDELVDGAAIAAASIKFSKNSSEPALLKEISALKPKTVCDLGCGSGSNLAKICNKLKINGLGIDYNAESLRLSSSLFGKNSLIKFVQDDISHIQRSYPGVEALLIDFVLHDFVPEQHCVRLLNSLLNTFPDMKHLLITDIAAPSKDFPHALPGFDYVHGLLEIPTRTYPEIKRVFSKSMYKLQKEVSLKLPNTFLWVLSPRQ